MIGSIEDRSALQPWWSCEDFWEDMFDFIFPPETLAYGEEVAVRSAALLGVAPPARIVDLGCGPGRVAVPIARMGFRVVGIDVQSGYLARARTRAEREGVVVELVRGDVSYLDVDAAFDGALSLFTSFGYLASRADDERLLARVRRALRPGARFVLETAHRDGVVRLLSERVREAPDGRRWREDPSFDLRAGVVEATWTLTSGARTRHFTTRLRAYTAGELVSMLDLAGFRDVRLLGSLDGGRPSLDSYTVVAVGTRPAS